MCKSLLKQGMFLWVLLFTAGCLQDRVSDQGTEVEVLPGIAPDPNSLVCDPFNGENSSSGGAEASGIHSRLHYIPGDGSGYSTVSDFITFGTEVDADIFFNQLFVPTRPFDRGFVTQGGQTLMAADGVTTLYEWFAMRFKGRLKLGSQDLPGSYQMAILSDDGAVLDIDHGNGLIERLVDNDGWHGTRMGCAADPLDLNVGDRVPFSLDYFQGPRFHIALVVLWRPWPSDPSQVQDPLCGKVGNSFWFDSTQDPPAPTANFQALLERGWRVLTPDNYLLPEANVTNPCNEPAPELSSVRVENIGSTSLSVLWDTSGPATSQVEIHEVLSGVRFLTEENRTLLSQHQVQVTGLKANTVYEIKAISRSSSGLSSESAVLTIKTIR